MNHAELISKRIIEMVRPDCEMKHRADQSNGEYDFDLFRGQSGVAAVEVTMSTNALKRRTRARISENQFIDAIVCKKGWLINPIEGSDIRKIRANADAYLGAIESTGTEQFFAYTDAAESPAVYRILCDLGIEAGSVIKWKPPVNHSINFPGDGGTVEKRVLIAILLEANKPDNKKKLAKAGLDLERHLFVYIDPTNYLPWKVLIDTSTIDAIATLPTEMTHIWAATETRSANEFAVWAAQNGHRWQTTRIILSP
jgi:hypothetical protein